MRIIFYSDNDALLDMVESLNSQNVFMTDDQEELLDLLEPEPDSDDDEDIIVFFDFNVAHITHDTNPLTSVTAINIAAIDNVTEPR